MHLFQINIDVRILVSAWILHFLALGATSFTCAISFVIITCIPQRYPYLEYFGVQMRHPLHMLTIIQFHFIICRLFIHTCTNLFIKSNLFTYHYNTSNISVCECGTHCMCGGVIMWTEAKVSGSRPLTSLLSSVHETHISKKGVSVPKMVPLKNR